MSALQLGSGGLVLLGCGKMGSAMLEGWLANGLAPGDVTVIDPKPSPWLQSLGINLNTSLPTSPSVLLLAVKPQMMGDALPQVTAFGGGNTLVLSVAAGTPIAAFEEAFGAATPVVRAMPNTPAAVRQGITALIGNAVATDAHLDTAESLLSAVGSVVRLSDEDQMDAVTGLSGSGPAYVFHLVETMAAAGVAEGLPPDLAMTLARSTVAGAGALLAGATDSAEQLRINVTSPNGTTAAGLNVLMPELTDLMRRTVGAAAHRSRELKG